MSFKKELLEILCCPHCRSDLKLNELFLECTGCHLKFEIKNDIPILLVEKAILPQGVKSLEELKTIQGKK